MNNTKTLRVLIIWSLLLPAGVAMGNHELWIHDTPIDDSGELIPGIPSQIGTLNLFTGEYTAVGTAPTVLYDLAYSPDGTLYGIEPYNDYYRRLWEIDPDDPAHGSVMRGYITTQLNPYIITNSLEFGSDGTLYTAGWYWAGSVLRWRLGLIAVQVTPGAASNPGVVVVDMGDDPAHASQGDLAFDGQGNLYLTVLSGDLVRLDAGQGTFEVIGPLGFDWAWAMSWDEHAGVMYAVSAISNELFTIDLATGHGTLFMNLGDQISFAGGAACFPAALSPDHVATYIDIKPGENPSVIHAGKGRVVPVAILGSAAVDVTQIDPLSIELYGMAVRRVGKGRLQVSYEDVNGDGRLDVVARLDMASFAPGSAVLRAALYSGVEVYGFQPASDPVELLGVSP